MAMPAIIARGTMCSVSVDELLAAGGAALEAGRWDEARAAFEGSLSIGETADACFGVAVAAWWLGDSRASVVAGTRAYALFRRSGDVEHAVQCAVWLGITYKANFANFTAANGWLGRAERLLEAMPPGPLHGWVWMARAYRMADLDAAEELTVRAADVARAAGDVDLELGALSQLGLIRVGKGQTDAGFALIDEAMAAALAGERTNLDTVVYACCDMLNAASWRATSIGPPSGAAWPTTSSRPTAARSCTPSAASTTAACSPPGGAGRTPSVSWRQGCASPRARLPDCMPER